MITKNKLFQCTFTLLLCLLNFVSTSLAQPSTSLNVITTDLDNFWEAFDKIQTSEDVDQQASYLETLFLDRASPGLIAIREARNYRAAEYLAAIQQYPLFWKSIRANTLRAKNLSTDLEKSIEQLRQLYPALRPAKIYFTIGVFRTGGTTMGDKVLIGCETSMCDQHTETSEFPAAMNYLKKHWATNPVDEILHTNVHEYLHTQQVEALNATLLGQCLREGIAEFVAALAMGTPSTENAIVAGRKQELKIKAAFEKQLFNTEYGFWLWSDRANEFQTRDLGYFVGHAIAEKYYAAAKDKTAAIQTMIELDYNSLDALAKFVDPLQYFSQPIAKLKKAQEKVKSPSVINIAPFKNGATNVDPTLTEITVHFSAEMSPRFRGHDFGPLGAPNALRIKDSHFGEDHKSITLIISPLQPNQRYQLILSSNYRNTHGIRIEPFLLDFTTGEN
ncbi:MAG: hypothetical protein AB8G15_23025 [Saprospiraceae bacterium]